MNPTIFIIFGVTGDLAQSKLLPALLGLYVKKLLPNKFAIVGFSRRYLSKEDFRQYVRDKMHVRPGQYREEDIKHFLDHTSYEQGHFDTTASYEALAKHLVAIDETFHQCSNKLFHLAVPPSFYETILDRLAESGLTIPCADDVGWTRVLVEKPFGSDTETARKLDKKLADLFAEEQIFRIDHYLAKEALQNILTFRFANALFEPLWNAQHIDKVHIKLLEKESVEGRGNFYDVIGALKDVGQNHILQMLALVAMERPRTFDAAGIRRERAKVLRSIKPITARNIGGKARGGRVEASRAETDGAVEATGANCRGQYESYRAERGVAPGSTTETYFRLETHIKNSRWKNVPLYLESGKGLAETKTEIDVYFKNPKGKSFGGTSDAGDHNDAASRQNILTFRIQPDEGIKIRFWVKTPGFSMSMSAEPKVLKFKYADFSSMSILPDAYERVLYDAIVGDQTLFTSTDEVMAAWKFITPVSAALDSLPLTVYKKGAREV